jgi:hypothetical protein
MVQVMESRPRTERIEPYEAQRDGYLPFTDDDLLGEPQDMQMETEEGVGH